MKRVRSRALIALAVFCSDAELPGATASFGLNGELRQNPADTAQESTQLAPGDTSLPSSVAQPLTLNEAIRRALAKNFRIKIEQLSVPIADAQVAEAFGQFDPVFAARYIRSEARNPPFADSTSGAILPTQNKADSFDAGITGLLPWGLSYDLGASVDNARVSSNGFADRYSSFGGITLTQPLLRNFGFGPGLLRVRIAQTGRAVSEWGFRQVVIDTITRVIFVYHDLYQARASLASARRSRELAASLVRDNEKRFIIGAMSEHDVTLARSRMANREEAILIASQSVRDQEHALKSLISNAHTPDLLALTFELAPPPAPPEDVVVSAASDFPTALEKRPDYQQAQWLVKRSELTHRYQRNQLLPRVDLVGSYGYSGVEADMNGSQRQVRRRDFPSYTAGAVVSIPLTSAAERSRSRIARLELRQAEIDLKELEQVIVVSLGNAAGQIETAQKRMVASRNSRQLSELALQAELKRLKVGAGNTFFVLQQQEIVSAAEISEARAQADYSKALAEYDRQLARTLEKHGIAIDPLLSASTVE